MEEPSFIPPHDADAERAALAAALGSLTGLDHVLRTLSPESYYLKAHGHIHRALLAFDGAGADVTTLAAHLKEQGVLEQVGGRAYLAQLAGTEHRAELAPDYVEIVRQKKLLRDLLALPQMIREAVEDSTQSADQIRDHLEMAVAALKPVQHEGRVMTAAQLSQRLVERASAAFVRAENGEEPDPAPTTGIPELDAVLKGLRPGTVTIVAARTNMGKSALAGGMAIASAQAGFHTALFVNEMLQDPVFERNVAMEARVVLDHIQTGKMTEEELDRVIATSHDIGRLPLHYVNVADWTVLDLKAEARRLHRLGQLDLLVIDYIQKIKPHTKDNREQQVSMISQEINNLSKELAIPIVVVAQLSRELEKRADKHPVLSDLRESGSLENDADAVILLYRDAYYSRAQREYQEEPPDYPEDAELICAKNRHGRAGTVRAGFWEKYAAFEPLRAIETRYAEESAPPEVTRPVYTPDDLFGLEAPPSLTEDNEDPFRG